MIAGLGHYSRRFLPRYSLQVLGFLDTFRIPGVSPDSSLYLSGLSTPISRVVMIQLINEQYHKQHEI
jgi:hypothetical protein